MWNAGKNLLKIFTVNNVVGRMDIFYFAILHWPCYIQLIINATGLYVMGYSFLNIGFITRYTKGNSTQLKVWVNEFPTVVQYWNDVAYR